MVDMAKIAPEITQLFTPGTVYCSLSWITLLRKAKVLFVGYPAVGAWLFIPQTTAKVKLVDQRFTVQTTLV